jgi:hypothetical protein
VIVKVTGINLSNDSAIDPTASVLQMGFVSSLDGGIVPPASWYPATWIANTLRQLYYGMILVGAPPGVVVLAAGTWVPWVYFTIGSETIQEPAGDTVTVLA